MLPPDDLEPNPARMYDYMLGGFHNFEVDRQAVAKLLATNPDVISIARCSRAFLRRVVSFCLDQGIDQFLDVGAGVVTVDNTHGMTHQRNPQARVVYIDIDELIVGYGQSLIVDDPTTEFIQADVRDTRAIVDHPLIRRLIDWSRPIALLATAVLPFIVDDTEATQAIHRLTAALPVGSYVAITHPVDANYDRDNLDQMEALYQQTTRPYRTRNRLAVEAFFEGLTLVEPGIVFLPLWHPTGPDDIFLDEPTRAIGVGGVGWKQHTT